MDAELPDFCCHACAKESPRRPIEETVEYEPNVPVIETPFPGVPAIERELNDIKIDDFKTDDVYEMSINLIENVMNISYLLGEHVWNKLTNTLGKLNK
jgi:hypothetical protein